MREASVNPTHRRSGNRHAGAGIHLDLRERVAAAARRLAGDRLVIGTAGNVSAREGDVVAITPTGAALERLEPEQVAILNLEGGQTGRGLAPSSRRAVHPRRPRPPPPRGPLPSPRPAGTAPSR